MKTALVPLADGFEEIEAMSVIDILRRADIQVTTVGLNTLDVVGAHQIVVKADQLISECVSNTYDLIALPGGMPGAKNLFESDLLKEMLRKQKIEKRFLAAICASPAVVFQAHNLLEGKRATCYPCFMKDLKSPSLENVVIDDKIITSQGPGTAIQFALKLVEVLVGKKKVKELREGMLVQ